MVVDADGCTQVATAAVGDIPPGDVIVTSTTDALCFGDANGTATASVSGTGTAPYHYEWFNASNISQGQDSITATGLPAGDYYVTITDANGCVSSSGIGTIGQPTVLSVACKLRCRCLMLLVHVMEMLLQCQLEGQLHIHTNGMMRYHKLQILH